MPITSLKFETVVINNFIGGSAAAAGAAAVPHSPAEVAAAPAEAHDDDDGFAKEAAAFLGSPSNASTSGSTSSGTPPSGPATPPVQPEPDSLTVSPAGSAGSSPFVIKRPSAEDEAKHDAEMDARRAIRNVQPSYPKPSISYTEADQPCIGIGERYYEIKKLGEQGNHHVVYEFAHDELIILPDGSTVNAKDVLVKLLRPELAPDEARNLLIKTWEGYESLCAFGKSLGMDNFAAKCYVPGNIYGYWLVERVPVKLDPNDKAVDAFAKRVLTANAEIMAKQNQEGINDFVMRNARRRANGSFCVVDYSAPEHEDRSMHCYRCLLAWSRGSKQQWDYFIADFPATIKDRMNAMLQDEMASNGNKFPISSNQ